MRYLLDTHYVLWSLFDPARLTAEVRDILVDRDSEKYVSSVSLWEISLKFGLGKLSLGGKSPEDVYLAVADAGFRILKIDDLDFASYHRLKSSPDHEDPFDRMLIRQAINHNFTVLSADRQFAQYRPEGLSLIS